MSVYENYPEVCSCNDLESLANRHHTWSMCEQFVLKCVLNENSYLH
jgi:hypothetical protein